MRALFLALALFLAPTVQAFQACETPAATKTFTRVAGFGDFPSCESAWAGIPAAQANGPLYTAKTEGPQCTLYYNGAVVRSLSGDGWSVVTEATCPATSLKINGACYPMSWGSLTQPQQAAIQSASYPSQAAADAACSSGMRSASAGRSPAAIAAAAAAAADAAAKGLSPAAQAAAADAAAKAIEAGKTAAEAAAAGAAAAAAQTATEPPPKDTTKPPDAPASAQPMSGIFYTPGTLSGGETFKTVTETFMTSVKNLSLVQGLTNFFKISASGSCPTYSLSFFGQVISIDFFCSSITAGILAIIAGVILFVAGFSAFRIAVL